MAEGLSDHVTADSFSFPHSGKPFPLSLRRDTASLLCEAKVTLLRRALVLAA